MNPQYRAAGFLIVILYISGVLTLLYSIILALEYGISLAFYYMVSGIISISVGQFLKAIIDIAKNSYLATQAIEKMASSSSKTTRDNERPSLKRFRTK